MRRNLPQKNINRHTFKTVLYSERILISVSNSALDGKVIQNVYKVNPPLFLWTSLKSLLLRGKDNKNWHKIVLFWFTWNDNTSSFIFRTKFEQIIHNDFSKLNILVQKTSDFLMHPYLWKALFLAHVTRKLFVKKVTQLIC